MCMWECVGADLVNPHGDGGGVCSSFALTQKCTQRKFVFLKGLLFENSECMSNLSILHLSCFSSNSLGEIKIRLKYTTLQSLGSLSFFFFF